MIHPTFGHIFKLCLPAKQQKYIVEFLHKRFKLRKLYAANLPKMPTRDAAMHLSFPCACGCNGEEGRKCFGVHFWAGDEELTRERPPSFTPFLKDCSRLAQRPHYFLHFLLDARLILGKRNKFILSELMIKTRSLGPQTCPFPQLQPMCSSKVPDIDSRHSG